MDESEFIFQPIQDELHCRIENLENVIARTDVRCKRRTTHNRQENDQ